MSPPTTGPADLGKYGGPHHNDRAASSGNVVPIVPTRARRHPFSIWLDRLRWWLV